MTDQKWLKALAVAGACTGLMLSASAEPVTYRIDPAHTYPSFEADHLGGVSKWRGKLNTSSGTIVYDKEGRAGSVEVTIDMNSIDFGHDGLNDHARSPDIFDTAQFPTATFTGRMADFDGEAPGAIEGELTMHGQTHPVTLSVEAFVCKPNPMRPTVEVCGADALAVIDRSQWGVSFGAPVFNMDVTLRISVEAAVAN